MHTLYRGRFAPSPTGPLHFGSLVSAVGSYCQAKKYQGKWLVRMEDLDPPREIPGAADDILRTLEAYHLYWDEDVLYQSQRSEAYEEAISQLNADNLTFPCGCTRKSIAKSWQKNRASIYPGTCRNGLPPGTLSVTTRIKVGSEVINVKDNVQGTFQIKLDSEVGDFVLKRADGLYAYHLAVVIDDAFQEISEIVRGADLLGSTPHHLYLQSLLSLQIPQYAHLPIAVNSRGEKLSKQTHAAPLDKEKPGVMLSKALTFLGHHPDAEVINADPDVLLSWAVENWDLQLIPSQHTIHIQEVNSK